MIRVASSIRVALLLTASIALAQNRGATAPPKDPPATFFSKNAPKDAVEFELMTWPEVYRAIHHDGKTTALVYTGGTEQRGPQNVNGGHNIMAHATVVEIARRLGNALVLPVLPYTPNNASAQNPGTIGLTPEILGLVLERVADQAIITGFKNVVLMGDHGGGQPNTYAAVTKKLENKYAAQAKANGRPQDVHVYYCDDVYEKAQNDYEATLKSKGLPTSSHAGIQDTSELMYLQSRLGPGHENDYTRLDLLPVAVNTSQPVPSGVSGDGRQSTAELGRLAFDNKVNYAVRQIKQQLGMK
jgi:creatinine amidohydrolase/Fe(II)-dependent formamide hydrolase-like protein